MGEEIRMKMNANDPHVWNALRKQLHLLYIEAHPTCGSLDVSYAAKWRDPNGREVIVKASTKQNLLDAILDRCLEEDRNESLSNSGPVKRTTQKNPYQRKI